METMNHCAAVRKETAQPRPSISLRSTLALLCCVFLMLGTAWSQTNVSVFPATRNVLPGKTFDINITISNVTDVHLYHVVVHFDNAVVRCDSIANGGFFPGTFFLHSPPTFPSDTASFITVDDALAGEQALSGSGVLFSLRCTALQLSSTPVLLTEVVLRDTLNQNIAHSLVNGAITVSIPAVVHVDWLYNPGNADGHEFGFDAFPTINEGVAAVANGGMVNVHAGTYGEQVYINKSLTLAGAGASVTSIIPPVTPMAQPFLPWRQERPIVGVDSLGSDVVIEGFTVDGEGSGNVQPFMVGIQYFKGSGAVRNTTIKRVRSTPFDGTQAFVGVLVNHDYPRTYAHTVEIAYDSIYDFGKGGIVCNHPGATANVHHNVVLGQGSVGYPLAAQNGIQFGFGATGTVAFNTIANLSYTGPGYSASGVLGAASDGILEITGNSIIETQTAINLQQMAAYENGGSSASVRQNTIEASSSGTGVPEYYGLVAWSSGPASFRVHQSPVKGMSVVSPFEGTGAERMGRSGNASRPLTSMTLTLHENSFTGSSSGVGCYFLAADASVQTVNADSNNFTGFRYAVVTDKDTGAVLTTTWRTNRFQNNNYGMYDVTGTLQDARQNWWGNTTGPRDTKSLPAIPNYNNPNGSGDSVTSFVDYKPWYLDPELTTLSQQLYPMRGGWNIVSVPLNVEDWSTSTLFPAAVSSAFTFDLGSGYVRKDTLEKGIGYWLKFPTPQSAAVNGLWRSSDTIYVERGWNMIGTISDPVPTIMVRQDPPTIIASPFFGFTTSYISADTLFPARGYWVKANHPGRVMLSSSFSSLAGSHSSMSDVLAHASSIMIADAGGNSQTLFLTGDHLKDGSLDYYELPPVPPSGVFDARFGSQRMLECVDGDGAREMPILISSASYPLTFSWDIQARSIVTSLLVDNKEISMRGTGSYTVGGQIEAIRLRVSAGSPLPSTFALEQNYPNPFNPATTIRYQLPVSARVVLKVFDLLGREVATLMDGVQDAGYKSVVFDANGLASGVYFFRLQAGNFIQTRRSLLLR